MEPKIVKKDLTNLTKKGYDVVILSQHNLAATWYYEREQAQMRGQSTNISGVPIDSDCTAWALHGLWPKKLDPTKSHTTKHSPTFSMGKKIPVDSQLVDDIEVMLKRMQPNVKNTKIKDFLEYQYIKHGSALQHNDGTPYKFNEYLNVGFDLYQKFNMNTILAMVNILPQHSYTLRHIYVALRKYFNRQPLIKLIKNLNTSTYYLREIMLYFDKNYGLINAELNEDVPLDTLVYYAKDRDDIIYENVINYPFAIPRAISENETALEPLCAIDNTNTVSVSEVVAGNEIVADSDVNDKNEIDFKSKETTTSLNIESPIVNVDCGLSQNQHGISFNFNIAVPLLNTSINIQLSELF